MFLPMVDIAVGDNTNLRTAVFHETAIQNGTGKAFSSANPGSLPQYFVDVSGTLTEFGFRSGS
jgi:hypothetical protein